MPSLFTNESSKGPLYQYWKERTSEETDLRDQRVEEAKLRSKGFTPLNAAYGPSSKESYSNREGRGPPGYAGELPTGVRPGSQSAGVVDYGLPTYTDTLTGVTAQQTNPTHGLLSSSEEKSRLQRLEAQHQQTQSDAAIAQTLSNDDAQVGDEDVDVEGKGKQPERRKSKVGKVGRWLADAATGYTKKQERW